MTTKSSLKPQSGSAAYWFLKLRDQLWKDPGEIPKQLGDVAAEEAGFSMWANFKESELRLIYDKIHDVRVKGEEGERYTGPSKNEGMTLLMEKMVHYGVEQSPEEETHEQWRETPLLFINPNKKMITSDGWRVIYQAFAEFDEEDQREGEEDQSEKGEPCRWQLQRIKLIDFLPLPDSDETRMCQIYVNDDGIPTQDGKHLEKFHLDIPPWQRPGGAWRTAKQRDQLFDTVDRNLPLPPIFLWKWKDKDGRTRFYVVDGQQRIEQFVNHREIWEPLQRKKKEGYQLSVIIVDTDDIQEDEKKFGVVRDLFYRLNQSGKRLSAIEVTLMTHHNHSLNDVLIDTARLIARSCKENKENLDPDLSWMRDLVSKSISRSSRGSRPFSSLATTKKGDTLSSDELIIYRTLTHACAYSVKDNSGERVGHRKSTAKTVTEAFKELDDTQKARQTITDLLTSFRLVHNIFGKDYAFLHPLSRRYNEFVTRVQVAESLEFLDVLLYNPKLWEQIKDSWSEGEYEATTDEVSKMWPRQTDDEVRGFMGYFVNQRQNASSIWVAHNEWKKRMTEFCHEPTLEDDFQTHKQTWENELAESIANLDNIMVGVNLKWHYFSRP